MKIISLKNIRRIVSLLSVFVILVSLCLIAGCGENDFSLYFGIDKMPKNIDPQLASSYSELLTVRNCFRGLMKLEGEEDVVPDLAENYTISPDQLTYTFTLKDAKWSNDEPVTAKDFVFAINRAATVSTKSPNMKLLECIENVEARYSDDNAKIGVWATDDKTLIIKLKEPDKRFISSLATAVFMPCNQAFFEKCGGKYGLGKNYILTNGNFKISSWQDGKSIKLSRTVKSDTKQLTVNHVYLTVSSTGKNNIERIKAAEIGMTVDNANNYDGISKKYTVQTLYEKNYAIVIKNANEKLANALATAIDRSIYSAKMDDRFVVAETIMPNDATLLGKSVSGKFQNHKYKFEFSKEQSREIFLEAVKEIGAKKMKNINVYLAENSELRPIVTDVISSWQSTLGAYINIKTFKSEVSVINDFNTTNNENYIAFIPFSNNAVDILNTFSNANDFNVLGEDYNALINKLNTAQTFEDATQYTNEALQILSKSPYVIPIISVPTSYIWNSSYKNVQFSTIDKTIDFSIISQ